MNTINPAAGGIRIEGLRKVYGHGDTAVEALKNVNMSVAPGEVVGLVGPSESGKSTLLKCLDAIIEPSAGRMYLGDELIYDNGWTSSDLRALRRDRIGFVFQAPYLIPFLDVTDNVALLPMLAGVPNEQARSRAPGAADRAGRGTSRQGRAVVTLRRRAAARVDCPCLVQPPASDSGR
jgi:putative ABC transport system ATP-binding protein